MGGLQDGATCAALAVATFAAKLIDGRHGPIDEVVNDAARAANDAVYSAYRGKGGATLSAVIVSPNGAGLGVNVGDSRVYAPLRNHPERKVLRLTTDDTMKEAFGSEGDGLLQFIGVGSGLKPHLFEVDPIHLVVITTDGAHFVEPKMFAEIIARSPDPKAIVERTVALSRWLGAPDNATVAAIDIQRVQSSSDPNLAEGAEIWTGGSEGPIYALFSRSTSDRQPQRHMAVSESEPRKQTNQARIEPDVVPAPKSTSKHKRKKKASSSSPAAEQLTIDVEVTKDSRSDADR
jgi:serine/threonine protein phosphatase PrpC